MPATRVASMLNRNDATDGRQIVMANGHDGDLAARVAELPPANTKRWVIRRKAEVVAAVRSRARGRSPEREEYTPYKPSLEEFLSWQHLIDSHGLAGLRVTRLQDYRGLDRERCTSRCFLFHFEYSFSTLGERRRVGRAASAMSRHRDPAPPPLLTSPRRGEENVALRPPRARQN